MKLILHMDTHVSHKHREQTFVMIKPDGVQRNLIGEVIGRLEKTGLKLVALKMIVPDEERLSTHYSKSDEWYQEKGQKRVDNMIAHGETPEKPAIEYGRDIVRSLLEYMSCGPAILMVWEGNQAMKIVKKLVGGTEPVSSEVGTIRTDYALDSYEMANLDSRAVRNLMHCTDPEDGKEEAAREIGIWFTPEEIIAYRHIQEVVLYDKTISGILN